MSLAPLAIDGGTPADLVRRLVRGMPRRGPVSIALLAASSAYIVMFAGTGVLRAVYPYPIDGVENGALEVVRRVLDGQPIYVVPTLGYVPLIYGPLYFYLAAAAALLTHSDLEALRLVSILSTLGSIALVVLLIRRETGSLLAGLVGGAVLSACNQLVEGALDVGRTDATTLFFMLAAIYAARIAALERDSTWRASACSGVCIGLALLTKQSSAGVALALLVLLGILRPSRLAAFVLGAGLTAGAGLLLLYLQSGTWPFYYLWQLPRQHQVLPELMTRFWDHVLERFTLPVVVAPFYLVMQARRGDRKHALFYLVVALAMIGSAWTSQATINGGRNVELPAFAAFALLFGLSLNEALRLIGSASPLARDVRAYVLFAAIYQLAVLLYNPRLVVPYRSDMWDGDRLSATLAALPGPIFAGGFQGFLYQTQGAVAPDLGAVLEIQGEQIRPSTREGDEWAGELAHALSTRQFTYVIVDPDENASMVTLLANAYGYVNLGSLFPPNDKYWEWRTGWSPKVDVWARPDLVGR